MNGVTRADLIAVLRHTLERIDAVYAAWEGGSAAFDTDDDLSAVDAVVPSPTMRSTPRSRRSSRRSMRSRW